MSIKPPPRQTIFSPDRVYRYTLWREVQPDNPEFPSMLTDYQRERRGHYVQFIGLNPSTADETVNDPTIRRCIDFAQRWGYSALCMTNLFAFRATDPNAMMNAEEPIGSHNFKWLGRVMVHAREIICCWGNYGNHLDQDVVVGHLIKYCGQAAKAKSFGTTGLARPKHPLYLDAKTPLVNYGWE